MQILCRHQEESVRDADELPGADQSIPEYVRDEGRPDHRVEKPVITRQFYECRSWPRLLLRVAGTLWPVLTY